MREKMNNVTQVGLPQPGNFMTTPDKILIEATGLVKKYGQRLAVDKVSLKIHGGEVFGLLGPNGAGKSTIIGMLSTYFRPTVGQVKINSLDTEKDSAKIKQLIGVVPQELAIYEDNTAEENMTFFADMFDMPKAVRKERTQYLLSSMGLWDRRKEVVKKYSGGMKRRLNLAVGLINDPFFVMMDEPTVGVDPQSRQNIYEIIAGIKAQGKAILYTTQYMEEAELLCDRIAIIDNGQLKIQGTLNELLERSEHRVVEKPRGLSELFLQLTGRELRDE
jgi:ABC-2 type transport system ATP-binding protein